MTLTANYTHTGKKVELIYKTVNKGQIGSKYWICGDAELEQKQSGREQKPQRATAKLR